jgi:signal transduction histidine kinase
MNKFKLNQFRAHLLYPIRPKLFFWTCTLLIFAMVVSMTLSLAQRRTIGSVWTDGPTNNIQLQSTSNPALIPLLGQTLTGISAENADESNQFLIGKNFRYHTGRWDIHADQRQNIQQIQARLNQFLDQPRVLLHFATGAAVSVEPHPIGVRGFGLGYWILTGLATTLLLLAAWVCTHHPIRANFIYALLSLGYVLNLLMMAGISTGDLTAPLNFVDWDYTIRSIADLLTVTTMVQSLVLHPVPSPKKQWIATASWVLAILAVSALPWIESMHWWYFRGIVGIIGLCALWLSYRTYKDHRHPLGIFFFRAGAAMFGIWLLLSLGIAIADYNSGEGLAVASIGTVLWTVFFALFLLLLPFLARSKQIVREFTLLSAITTLATILHLLCISAFGLDAFTALILTVLVSMTSYTLTRQWLLDRSIGRQAASTQHIFEQIYSTLENVQATGELPPEVAETLLQSVFDPKHSQKLAYTKKTATVARDGSHMSVPIPFNASTSASASGSASTPRSLAIYLHKASQGQRIFTLEDAHMADAVIAKLNQTLNVQRARAQGQKEERLRLAQDLHDDIGARLLTLMYKAPSTEIEDYIRHTLQDLKTLTRGLATGQHGLSDSAGEWRTDATRRLQATRCELEWRNDFDADIELTVVQWSTLTRVLRELISNVISHSQATRVSVYILLRQGNLTLRVADNGIATAPETWNQGLGLSGIRKRIKQLNGQVEWRLSEAGGIVCAIEVESFALQRNLL